MKSEMAIENRLFYYALLISFLVHVSVISVLSILKSEHLAHSFKDVEIRYQTVKAINTVEKKNAPVNIDLSHRKKESASQVDILTRKGDVSSKVLLDQGKGLEKIPETLSWSKKKSSEIKTLDAQRTVSIPRLDTGKITNPQYLSYEDNLRRNILNRAYRHLDHPDFETGKVYVTFVLASNGSLKDLQIRKDKTVANDYLQDITSRIVKEASPFPPFPKGFNYPEFTFNVLIIYNKDEN